MKLTSFQETMEKERRKVIKKFQKMNKTKEEKEEALRNMENKDIHFLTYCSDTLYANVFYSKFLKK